MSKRTQKNEEKNSYLNMNSKNASDKKPSSRVKSSKNNVARERWNILKQAILNKSREVKSKASARRFDSFGLVQSEKIDEEDFFEWHQITVPSINENEGVRVRFYKGPISLDELGGFDNTGNVCLWPSEEIMTYFCLKNGIIFKNKSVCELGGGMTCLAGLLISKICDPKEVFLTDGNESSFENLEVICSENEFKNTVESCLLEWKKGTEYGDLENRFDYIICADCVFFDEYREDLCATIHKLLKPNGTCLIFAPNRKNTFHKFVDLAKLYFECMIVQNYDDEIWQLNNDNKESNGDYDEDVHYPLLLKLCKRDTNNGFCKMVL